MRVGLLTLVTSRVGSVTSTSFRVCVGDMRTISGPIVPVSSGTLPGHSSTTVGVPAAAERQAVHSQEIRETTATIRFMVAPEFSEPGDTLKRRVPAQVVFHDPESWRAKKHNTTNAPSG